GMTEFYKMTRNCLKCEKSASILPKMSGQIWDCWPEEQLILYQQAWPHALEHPPLICPLF
ncbi:hypothetical protein, partial [Acetobacter tropicalis]|uniref:hypothetical protein n=1 Tax=Acetobacter tropicalis TaxID=104102 RepID=UPI0022329F2A